MAERDRERQDHEAAERDQAGVAHAPSERSSPSRGGPGAGVLALQQAAGNQAVVAALARHGIQPNLVVGHVDDPAEREADRMAAQALSNIKRSPAETDGDAGADPVRRVPQTGLPAVGREGGVVDDQLDAAIERSRGGGRPLPDGVRRQMEQGFGTDLGDVRVHADGQAAELSAAISARAFTTGNDIFFGKGEYQPESASGRHVLAHEIAHTVQQTGNRAERVHRMTVDDTEWASVTAARFYPGAGSPGVFWVSDGSGKELGIKTGQKNAPEVRVALTLMEKAMDAPGDQRDGWSGTTGGTSRLISGTEAGDAKAAVQQFVRPKDGDDKDTQNFNERLQQALAGFDVDGSCVVFEWYPGAVEFEKSYMTREAHGMETKKKGLFGGKQTVADPTSALVDFMQNPGQLFTLGRATVVDLLVGNFDRVAMWNPKNWLVDMVNRKLVLIDPVDDKDWSFLRQAGTVSPRASFDKWVFELLNAYNGDIRKPATLTANVMAVFEQDLGQGNIFKYGDTYKGLDKEADTKIITSLYPSCKKQMSDAFVQGYSEGYRIVKSLLVNDLETFVAAAPAPYRDEMRTSLIARRIFLMDMKDAETAWAKAAEETNRRVAENQAQEERERQRERKDRRKGGFFRPVVS